MVVVAVGGAGAAVGGAALAAGGSTALGDDGLEDSWAVHTPAASAWYPGSQAKHCAARGRDGVWAASAVLSWAQQ